MNTVELIFEFEARLKLHVKHANELVVVMAMNVNHLEKSLALDVHFCIGG